ncbi:glycosyltransferase family 1 protein [Mucilaginibacter sp. PPCGB 2223]|uniref:glycosyltransferase family 4 protein n=1 Tax=Mucilaginibacter sp. PPCGB 2223 TaxID=1886027 RepID=UPI001586BCCE|nr:glycosyltransferase family 1 protein [Mucilaginibacter sp. PPCGB 2223]
MTRELVSKYNEGEICILVPNQPINSSYNVSGFPIKTIGKLKSVFWEQIDLPYFLYKNGKELLISFVNTAPLIYKNQFVSILDLTVFVNPKWFSKAFYYYYKFALPRIAKNSKLIITISECSKNDIVNILKVEPDKIVVIYCGVANEFTNTGSPSPECENILKRLEVKKKGYLLGVSSLEPRKNFVKLVQAYKKLNNDALPLVIVGSEGKVFADHDLKEMITDSPNIKLTGYITDVELAYLYRSAFCFIYPSLYEGFGMPPLEAMASGCPTIVSDTSSLPEVCGDASLYVNPYDVDLLTEAMIRLHEDPQLRAGLIEKGAGQYKKFSWKKSGDALEKIINDFRYQSYI